jgi:L-lactate dehydrogenase complex protein LldG
MERDAFLARVKQAATAGRAYSVEIKPFPPETGYVGLRPDEDICERFAAEVREVGGEAVVVSSLKAAREQLKSWLAAANVKQAFTWQHDLLDRLGLSNVLSEAEIKDIAHPHLAALSPDDRRASILSCDIGLTSCTLAIAETGTLWLHSAPGQERLASLAPPRHIAIVERSQIVPDLLDAFAWLEQQGAGRLPSNLALVTGPSKTGDIELQLTTGVHGPGIWQVLVIG